MWTVANQEVSEWLFQQCGSLEQLNQHFPAFNQVLDAVAELASP